MSAGQRRQAGGAPKPAPSSTNPPWWATGPTSSLWEAAQRLGVHPDRIAHLAKRTPWGPRVADSDLRAWAQEWAAWRGDPTDGRTPKPRR